MRLWVDPDRLASRGITAEDVVQALREQNVQVAAGQVGQPPAREGQTYQISVRAVGRLAEPSEFENIILKRSTDGTLVRLKDVGRAELGAESYTSTLRYNGRDGVGFGVLPLPDANALEVYQNVVAEFDRLSADFPPGLKHRGRLRHDDGRVGLDPRSGHHAHGGDCARRAGDVPVPPELAHDPHSRDHHPGVARRNVRVREAVRLLDQHAHPVRHHAGHGPRGRRRHRRHREHRAPHPRLPPARRPRPRPGHGRK